MAGRRIGKEVEADAYCLGNWDKSGDIGLKARANGEIWKSHPLPLTFF